MEAYRDCPNTFSFDSVTSEFETIYSFIVTLRSEDNAPAFAAIEAFSKYLFSRSALESRSNIKETTEMELQIVDNEFHEKLNYKNFRKIHKMAAILETEGLHLFKFGAGNKKTLNQIDRTNLIKEFEKLRELYRQRPLNVCIYSAHKLEMVKIFSVQIVYWYLLAHSALMSMIAEENFRIVELWRFSYYESPTKKP